MNTWSVLRVSAFEGTSPFGFERFISPSLPLFVSYLLNRVCSLFFSLSISSEIRNNEIHIAVIDYSYINIICVTLIFGYTTTLLKRTLPDTLIENISKWS